MSSGTLVAQSGVLILIRVGLYQFCQRIVLRPLVQDLRQLSKSPSTPLASSSTHSLSFPQSPVETSEADEDPTLPTPVSASTSSRIPHSPTSTSFKRFDGSTSKTSLSKFIPSLGSSKSRNVGGSTGRQFHSWTSRTAFALCFSESILLFVMVLCQSIDVLSESTLLFNWKLSLSAVLALVMFFIPLLQSVFMTYRFSSGVLQKRNLVALIPFFSYLYLVTFIPGSPDSSTTNTQPPSTQLAFPLPQALARLTLTGVIILGILSGFGSVRNASVLLSSLPSRKRTGKLTDRKRGGISAEDLTHAEGSLRRVRADLEDRRAQRTRMASVAALAGDSQKGSSWIPKVFSGANDESSGLNHEISGLEALERNMSRSLSAMRARRELDVYSKTFSGRLMNGATALFGIYCLYRMIVSTLNLLLPWSRATPEAEGAAPTDVIIRWLLATFPSLETTLELTPERAVSLSRQFSLVMVGLIVLSSVRLVLRGVNKTLRVTSKNLGASFMLLILAQLMTTYLISTLVQLRASFPPPVYTPGGTTSGSAPLFSTLPKFEVFGPLFDLSFMVATVVSALFRWIGGAFSEEEPWGWEMVDVTRR